MSIPTISSFSNRILTIDALRGFALLGLFLVHCSEFFDLYWMDPKPSKVQEVVFFLFAGKSFAIFALLFGLSFYLIMEGEKRNGNSGEGRFVWRLFVLFVFGYLHCLLYAGDILQVLASLGIILIIGNQIKTKWLLWLGIAFLLNGYLIYHFYAAINNLPHANDQPMHWQLSQPLFQVWSTGTFVESLKISGWEGFISKWYFYIESGRVVQILGLFLLGLWLGRIGLFVQKPVKSQPILFALVGTVIAAFAIYEIQKFVRKLPLDYFQKEGMANYYLEQWLNSGFGTAMVVFWVTFFILLSQYSFGQKVLQILAPAGRMSLTLYVLQSIFCIPVYFGFGFGAYKIFDQTTSLLFGLFVFGLQLAFAHWWMGRYKFGPLERVWRSITYGKATGIRK